MPISRMPNSIIQTRLRPYLFFSLKSSLSFYLPGPAGDARDAAGADPAAGPGDAVRLSGLRVLYDGRHGDLLSSDFSLFFRKLRNPLPEKLDQGPVAAGVDNGAQAHDGPDAAMGHEEENHGPSTSMP